MKPGDHPDFFRFPAPPGRSRESTIVLDRQGRFHHDGELVEHPAMAEGFARWVRRHPDDGRYILNNGYDWCYFTVEDTAYFVTALAAAGDQIELELSDGSRETLDPATLRIDDDEVLRVSVKSGADDARFTRQAQLQVEPFLCDDEPLAIDVGGRRYEIGQ